MEIYDLSVRITDEAIAFPGDPPFKLELVKTIRAGNSCNLSGIAMSLHRGAHLDTPRHFIDGGKTLEDYPIERFLVTAHVVEVASGYQILPEHFRDLVPAPGEAILFKTDNSRQGWCRSGALRDRYAAVTVVAANRLTELRVGLVGIDYPTVEPRGNRAYSVHKTLLGADILILEGIDLSAVPTGQYLLHCLPLNLPGAEASPVRAVLTR
jgi:arylformamidase